MFLVKEREMIADDIFRDFFVGVLLDKKNIISDLKIFDMCYSDFLRIDSSKIIRVHEPYELDDRTICIDSQLIDDCDNIGILLSYFYQKRMQIQNNCIINNYRMNSLMYDLSIISLKNVKTPLTDKCYSDFEENNSLEHLTPWTIDAHCFASSTLAKLIEQYLEYCKKNNLPVKGNREQLERTRYKLIERYSSMYSNKNINSRKQESIDLFIKEIEKEKDYINKVKDRLFNGSIDAETMIIGEKAIEYLDEEEIATLNVGNNEIAKKRYIANIGMKEKSIEEICDYIIHKNTNNRR